MEFLGSLFILVLIFIGLCICVGLIVWVFNTVYMLFVEIIEVIKELIKP